MWRAAVPLPKRPPYTKIPYTPQKRDTTQHWSILSSTVHAIDAFMHSRRVGCAYAVPKAPARPTAVANKKNAFFIFSISIPIPKSSVLKKPGLAVLATLYVDAIHATQALHQCTAILIAVIEAGVAGLFTCFTRRQGVGGRAEGAGKTKGGAKDKHGFLYIDHFYSIPKV